ncbi:MAG: two pore domain potassium channel family protein [Methanosphaera sp.]|nr:two pore domain potassium channel family protein [Methanosphaera sp.]
MINKEDLENVNRETMTELKSVILLILTLIDLIFIFLSTIYSFSFKVDNIFADYDFLVCLLLFIDLSYDFYTSNKSFKEYFINDKQIISLLSLLPFDILFRYFSVFRLFRFLRIIKIVRVWHVLKDLDSLYYFIKHHMLKLLLILLLIYVALSSVLLIVFDTAIDNLQEALWFIVVTISSVGYGDIVPVNPISKSLAVLTILIGTVSVAIFTAYLSAMYNQKPEMERKDAFIEYFNKLDETNNALNDKVSDLNDKVSVMEEENKLLKDKLDGMTDKLDAISDKL